MEGVCEYNGMGNAELEARREVAAAKMQTATDKWVRVENLLDDIQARLVRDAEQAALEMDEAEGDLRVIEYVLKQRGVSVVTA